MLSKVQLRQIAADRLADAQVHFDAARYDGAVYLCGYSVEMALKARICETLGWPDFPERSGGFRELLTSKTHNLDILLRLSGREGQVKATYFTSWSLVAQWDPEVRYRPSGQVTALDATQMLAAVKVILEQI